MLFIINNAVLKNYVSILEQIVWETQKMALKFLVDQSVLVILIKTIFCMVWSKTQEPLAYWNFNAIFSFSDNWGTLPIYWVTFSFILLPDWGSPCKIVEPCKEWMLNIGMSTVCLPQFGQKVDWVRFGKTLFNWLTDSWLSESVVCRIHIKIP